MIATKMDLENLKEVRKMKHTEIYYGELNNKGYYLKILKNYHKKVKKQDVLKSKKDLETIGLKCFNVVESGSFKGEKYYISEEVKGKDFEELLQEGKTFDELSSLILESMSHFMKMLKNDLFYFGYNLKNFMVVDKDLVLIDIEEVQKKIFFKEKAATKTIWNSLRSLKAGADRCNLSYEKLEEMLYEKYEEVIGDSSRVKRNIARYQSLRDKKRNMKLKKK